VAADHRLTRTQPLLRWLKSSGTKCLSFCVTLQERAATSSPSTPRTVLRPWDTGGRLQLLQGQSLAPCMPRYGLVGLGSLFLQGHSCLHQSHMSIPTPCNHEHPPVQPIHTTVPSQHPLARRTTFTL
jgi:hypothetical protein